MSPARLSFPMHVVGLLFGLFLTGTFVEEIFYRGYIIERMTSGHVTQGTRQT